MNHAKLILENMYIYIAETKMDRETVQRTIVRKALLVEGISIGGGVTTDFLKAPPL